MFAVGVRRRKLDGKLELRMPGVYQGFNLTEALGQVHRHFRHKLRRSARRWLAARPARIAFSVGYRIPR